MIIWTGWGILVLLFFGLSTVFGGFLGGMLFPQDKVLKSLTMSLAIISASFLLWKIGRSLNSEKKNRVLLDKNTNKEIILKPSHKLFFIKMEYWAILMGIIGVLSIFSAGR